MLHRAPYLENTAACGICSGQDILRCTGHNQCSYWCRDCGAFLPDGNEDWQARKQLAEVEALCKRFGVERFDQGQHRTVRITMMGSSAQTDLSAMFGHMSKLLRHILDGTEPGARGRGAPKARTE